jgi:hypothetical protein
MQTDILRNSATKQVPKALRFMLRRLAQKALGRTKHDRGASPAFVRQHAAIRASFLEGYIAGIDSPDHGETAARLDTVAADFRGFAYEGASMALSLLDSLLPGRPTLLHSFMTTVADDHVYMAHVGAGWGAARLWRSSQATRRGLDPLLGWLALDGYGFHAGYFRSYRAIRLGWRPARFRGYDGRAFDQGVGRSLWFVQGGRVDRIADSLQRFDPARHTDLWSGVGLAAAYAGGVGAVDLQRLKRRAGVHAHYLAQGAAFAAEARERARNQTEHTHLACEILASLTATHAALLVRRLRNGVIDTPDTPAYERWRIRVATAAVSTGGVSARVS